MSLHADLLAQAEYLARRESKRPKQASLRRAISAAYYALFHLLISEAARHFVTDDKLINSINRFYGHKEMNEVSKSFAKDDWPKAFDSVKGVFAIPPELQNVAQAFVVLQQARHDADYNLAKKFTRSDAASFVEQAKNAFEAWNTVRRHDLAKIYLACFLIWDKWNKTR